MATLWGGRFEKETDAKVKAFNDSISFDKRLYRCDIKGSIAHADMLGHVGVISKEEGVEIINGLESILADIEKGVLTIDESFEDIHSFVEATLTERIGQAGKKLHTGRSRNDQVALDMRMHVRDCVDEHKKILLALLEVIFDLMKEHTESYMPGFTHLQKAQPTTLAHHLGAYFEMFYRDSDRLGDIRRRMNQSPLGAGALCGTTYPLDREYTARALGFDMATANSMDSVSDRDYLIEYLSALSLIMMHLSRFCEEIIIWNSNEYGFIDLDDAYSTGSSIMPQKKNPDIAELVRGKCGRVYGALNSMLVTMKSLPLAYNKDMQEDKELSFDAIDTVSNCLLLFTEMLKTTGFNKDRMKQSAVKGFTNATDVADYLVKKGMPFRDAHSVVGQIVLYAQKEGISIDDISIERLKDFSDLIEEDIYQEISLETVVSKRVTKGSPGPKALAEEIAFCRERIEKLKALCQ